jgi:hypothetical protein
MVLFIVKIGWHVQQMNFSDAIEDTCLLKVLTTDSFILLLGDCSKLLVKISRLLRQLHKNTPTTKQISKTDMYHYRKIQSEV